MTAKQLRKITQEEFNGALIDHFFYQKGDESKRMIFKDCDFSGIKLIGSDLSGAIFDGSDFRNAMNRIVTSINHGDQFQECILDNASFRDCNLMGINFYLARSMNGTILIGAKFQPKTLGGFENRVIVTNEQLQELLRKSEGVIEKQEEEIQEKDEKLKKTSEEQSKGMLNIFEELQKDFSVEERIWIIFGYIIFSILLFITSSIISNISPILSMFINFIFLTSIALVIDLLNNKNKKSVKYTFDEIVTILFAVIVAAGPLIYFGYESWIVIFKTGESWFKLMDTKTMKWEFITPISVLFLSTLWFSVHQYGRAKKLRIEQQNKQAMIHFMQAIIANDGKVSEENQTFPKFAPFFANAIIHRPFSQDNYDPELPVDELLKRMKDFKDFIR